MAGFERLALEVQRSARSAVIVVLMAALGLTSLVLIFSHISFQDPFASTYDVNAVFPDVKGSDPGHEPVYIAGIKIGVNFSLQNKLIRQAVDVDGWIDRRFVDVALRDLNLVGYWQPRKAPPSLAKQ